ncbi:aminotransferase class IV [Kiritimatiellaeota bacterium B1221]|nr:aminotransferase class IV [Kiritimatiellaeota bacterium B1221]
MRTPLWSLDELNRALSRGENGVSDKALVMYSSLWGAMITDPRGMLVPVEDHLVHRGDGVFETLLFEGRGIYNLEAHLQRLERSANRIGLRCPFSRERLTQILEDCFAASQTPRALARVLLGRGPGGFSVDPAECPAASLYVVVYRAPPPFMEMYPGGARAVLSKVPPKPGGLATVKTCNYLPNALMKAEASAAGVHFALGVDDEGYLTESATENLAGVDREGNFILLPATAHLAGTTLQRVAELAASAGRKVVERRLRAPELFELAEVLIVGTTTYVTALVALEGRALPTGPVQSELDALLHADIG